MADAKRERERKLFELRNKRNQARKSNKDEVLAETIGEKVGKADGHQEYLERRRQAERDVEEQGLDKETERMLGTTAQEMAAERAKKDRTEKRQAFRFDLHNSESKYRSYKKRLGRLEKHSDGRQHYEQVKRANEEDLDRHLDDLRYGEAPEVPKERMDLLLDDMKKSKEDRLKFKRHRAEFDDEDIAHINHGNKKFNKKIDRAFGQSQKFDKNAEGMSVDLQRGMNMTDIMRNDEAMQLRIELDTVRADLVRTECELQLSRGDAKNRRKLERAFGKLRDHVKRVEADLHATNETLQKERRLLETATRKRLEAEREAAAARLEAATLKEKLEMLQLGLSPAGTCDADSQQSAPLAAVAVANAASVGDEKPDTLEKQAEGEDEEKKEEEEEEDDDNIEEEKADDQDCPNEEQENSARSFNEEPEEGELRHHEPFAGSPGFDDSGANHGPKRRKSGAEDSNDHHNKQKDADYDEEDEFVPPTAPCPVTPVSQTSVKRSREDSVPPLVMLTGYGDGSGVKTRLMRKLKSLGGDVFVGRDFNDSITHVVSPSDAGPNPKVIAGMLTGKWVLSDTWITDSFDSNEWKPEGNYGTRKNDSVPPFSGLKFYLHSSFVEGSSEERVRTTRQLIQLGGGQLVEWDAEGNNVANLDYRIVSRVHGRTRSYDTTWPELLENTMLGFDGGQLKTKAATTTTPSSSAKKKMRVLHLSNEEPQ